MDFQVGDYVLHPHHGVGRIREIVAGDGSDLRIDYHRQTESRVSARLIATSVRPLSPDGFLALWYEDAAGALKLLDDDPARAVALALGDFPDARAKTENLKDYFAPCFKDRDWTKWWKKTQQAVKRAEFIDTSKSDAREYRLRKETVSLAEEAFSRFQRTRVRGDFKKAYEDTKAVFNAIKKSAILSDTHVEVLKGFYAQVSGDASSDVAMRLDAIYRLEELKWLAPEDARATKHALVRGLKLYRVEAFAENRLLDFLLANANDPEMQVTLLTGLCASLVAMDRVYPWVIKRGDPELILSALRVALAENLPPELHPSEHGTLAARLDWSGSLVEFLTASPDILQECVSLYENPMRRIGSLKQIEGDTKHLVVSLVRLGNTLFKRAVSIQPELGPQLVAALVAPSCSSEFVLRVLEAQGKAQISDSYNAQLEGYVLEHARSTSDPVLSLLLGTPGEDRVLGVARLVEIARQHGSQNEYLLNQIAEKVQSFCRGASDNDLVQMIPDLDAMVHLGESMAWKEVIGNFRRRAYFVALNGFIPAALSGTAGQVGVLDHFVALAISDYMQQQSKELLAQVTEYRKNLREQEKKIQELNTRLEETRGRMGELRQGYVQNPQQTRYEERYRILREFAASVAEFERFYSRPERQSPEVDAFLRRMNSLLAGQGVFPRETIGNVIVFDPSFCQIIVESDNQAMNTNQVQVIERGYTIKDAQGTVRMLRLVLVRPID